MEAADVAEILSDLKESDEAVVFRLLSRSRMTEVFEYLPFEDQEALLKRLSGESIKWVLNEMSPDDRTQFLEELPAAMALRLLGMLTPAERRIANTLLGYPEESIGRLMTTEFMAIRETWTVAETLDFLRQKGENRETLNVLYVLNVEGVLLDEIHLRQLVLAQPTQTIAELMDGKCVSLDVTKDQEEAVESFKKYDRVALPVVDSTERLVGIVTVDDVLDVAEEEATEDIQKMAAVEALEEPYFETSFWVMIRKRGVWLVTLFFGQMFTVSAMKHFEELALFRSHLFGALVVFISLIVSSGGNAGSQAAGLVIRGIAVREMELKDCWRVFFREVVIGITLGIFLGFLGLLRGFWGAEVSLLIPLTIAISLIGIVLFGTFIGSMLPFLFQRLGFDPAVTSGPFITTLVDVMGVVIYFSTAVFLMRYIAY